MPLYKYLAENKVERFVQGHIYLTPPKYLPTDVTEFAFSREPMTAEEALKSAEKTLREMYDHVRANNPVCPSFDQFVVMHRDITMQYIEATQQKAYTDGFAQRIREVLSQYFGVISLSDDSSSMRMWMEFADQFRGFLIAIDSSPANDIGLGYAGCMAFGNRMAATRVVYANEKPLIRGFDHEGMFSALYVKLREAYAFEREWRIVWPLQCASYSEMVNGARHYFISADPKALLKVAIGKRMSDRNKKLLLDYLQKPDAAHVELSLVSASDDGKRLAEEMLENAAS